MANMEICKAGLDDLKKILDLQYLAYQSEAALFGTNDIPPLKQTLEEVKQEYKNGIILKMISENDEIIGSVRAQEDNGTVYIGKLMVHPDFRGRGYGTMLLSEIEKYYPRKRYELFTSTRSEANIRLYQKNGYSIFDRKLVNEELVFVYMEKPKHYLGVVFLNGMYDYLINPEKNNSPYQDLDTQFGVEVGYYKDLASFLIKSFNPKKNTEPDVEDDIAIYEFVKPGNKECPEECEDATKIAVLKNESPCFLLTSDTFGFSVERKPRKDKQQQPVTYPDPKGNDKGYYPYGALYQLSDTNNPDNNVFIENSKFISKCIFDTRTLGGAFLWPTNVVWNNDQWKGIRSLNYNTKRGVGSIIEDRVDLTLYEIKKYYVYKEDKKNNLDFESDKFKLSTYMFGEDIWLEDWLNLFGSFERYVDFLCFQPFVVKDENEKYWPIDIIESDLSYHIEKGGHPYQSGNCCLSTRSYPWGGDDKGIEKIDDLPKPKEYRIKTMYKKEDIKGLKQMLENVRLLTLERTKLMEELKSGKCTDNSSSTS